MNAKSYRQRLAAPYVQSSVRISTSVLMLLAAALGAAAQTINWDTSGNGLLKGAYYFREAAWQVGDSSGNLGEAVAAYGQITFDGNGNYSISGSFLDAGNNSLQTLSMTGTYSIAASGYGFLSSPISNGDSVYGLVSQGIFIGSSTENQSSFNDLFIAAPLASPAPTISSLKGTYQMVGVDSPTFNIQETRDFVMTMNADGNGNLSNVVLNGYFAFKNTPSQQNIGNIKYTFSNGGASILFPAFTSSNVDTNLMGGQHFFYISPDGNFIFGGASQGIDMMVGIRTGSGAPKFSGLYYQAGMDVDGSQLASSGSATIDGFFGSLKALGNGDILGHQRLLSTAFGAPYDSTYADTITINSDGTADDSQEHYFFGAGGAIRVGLGQFLNSGLLGISAALAAPTFQSPSSAPFLDPTGITNTASSALFTTSIAPGELLTLYGSNLAKDSRQDATFPTTLDGVQVQINNVLAPILSVNGCGPFPCVTVMVPYETTGSVARIQLTNNGAASNTITAFVAVVAGATAGTTAPGTAPGVFTIPPGGLSDAAAQHTTDFSTITQQNPAQPGETIALYLTGIGPVNPAVATGAPGPVPLATAVNEIDVFIGGTQAQSTFVGLTPSVIGLAQINATIPTGLKAGQYVVEVAGPDSDTFEATIWVGSGGKAEPATTPLAVRPAHRRARALSKPPAIRPLKRLGPPLN